ncbi:thioredoxin [Macellibacteroides fermentans]|jgi:thioredoxin|uniref:Thioredoxin n=2 Tax=root TaxID=1 RepID=A0A8E2D2Q8_9PORP|nr:thioredoxin [Macellibacteroides fermentans]MBP7919926.1 thioredoxin [Parabacteroides sp.]OCW92966.1 thioredoxin [Macellibacteroides sp. HH-ZS]MBP7939257.1 thioredoxin [Parabacteroides sp.]MBP8026525.1 thioredoxin [Parabacteroides sp.]MEA4810461.1 thioredoxin [Macellibacteroides fermentans]
MKKIALFMVLGIITLASCNAKEAGNKTAQNEINKKENNSNSKTESKMKTIHLTKAEFLTKVANYEANPQEWKYLGDRPAIIDFYADWCGPCKSIAPVLEELAAEYDGQIYIYKINTETEQELASAFGIRSIPSLLFVPMNEAPQMAQGAMPKSAFKEAIETVLLKKK